MTDQAKGATGQGGSVARHAAQRPSVRSRMNRNSAAEERVLRILDALAVDGDCDPHWLAIARTHIEQGFMAASRAIMQPGRLNLPEDRDDAS